MIMRCNLRHRRNDVAKEELDYTLTAAGNGDVVGGVARGKRGLRRYTR